MTNNIQSETFEIIDVLYQELTDKHADQQLLNILLKAAKALNNGMAPQIVAARTYNGFTLWILSHKFYFGDQISDQLSQLTVIARSGVYKWTATGIGDLRVQFD